jgi:hypothetical protein
MESPPTVTVDSQTRKKIQCKQELIIASLQRFYTARDDLNEVVELLKGTSEISLRLVDWFVTNYAKVHSTAYTANGQEFVVYMNYKNQLKAYSKKLFDPFCRRERIMFQIEGYPMFQTPVGKLNFFRWAIEKGVLNYIKLNIPRIEKAMNASAKELNTARKAVSASTTSTTSTRGETRKRLPSTVAGIATNMQKHEYTVEVRFD